MNDINPSIGCTVTSCKYHSNSKDYCALEKIQVGCHESDPSVVQCTDCQSFEKK